MKNQITINPLKKLVLLRCIAFILFVSYYAIAFADNEITILTTWYLDADGDEYGDPGQFIIAETQPSGYVANGDDCDDVNGYVHPGAEEDCDGIDNDCDGLIDAVDPDVYNPIRWYADADSDGYGDINTFINTCDGEFIPPEGYILYAGGDCDDSNPAIHPGSIEIPCNGIDEDCNGVTDQEICNDLDDNCNGLIDEGLEMLTWYPDYDGDGCFNPFISINSCSEPGPGWSTESLYVHCWDYCELDGLATAPCYTEFCNGIDDDGNGLIDEDDPGLGGTMPWYADADGDGFGDLNNLVMSCTQPDGYLPWRSDIWYGGSESPYLDCDDTNPFVHPGATEIPDNGIDDNCDGCLIEQEVCNGLDDDCDGLIDDADESCIGLIIWYADNDNDGFGNSEASLLTCLQPEGHVGTGTDCNDSNPNVNPEAAEIPDGLDNDCDGIVDEGLNQLNIEAGDCEVVYNGYAPEACQTLSITVAGGTSPYTYAWSNGGTTASTVVCPVESTVYNVVVTDHNGNTAEDNVTVQVIDVRCGNNNNKVLVCHIPPNNPNNPQVICITSSAVADHLSHGDVLGVCNAPNPCAEENQSLVVGSSNPEVSENGHLNYSLDPTNPDQLINGSVKTLTNPVLNIFPNPTKGHFNLELHLPDAEMENMINVINTDGRIIKAFEPALSNTWNLVIEESGIYFVQFVIGKQVITKKLIVIQ